MLKPPPPNKNSGCVPADNNGPLASTDWSGYGLIRDMALVELREGVARFKDYRELSSRDYRCGFRRERARVQNAFNSS